MNKWLSILLMLGFATTNVVWAQYDDEYEDEEYEEEAPAPKKKSSKKKAKEETASGPSRIGLQAGFMGFNSIGGISYVAGVYDLGTGLEIGLGLGLNRHSASPDEGDAPDAVQTIAIVPSINYALGKGLLDYGLGVNLGIISKDAGVDIFATPNFYTSVELVKNVSIRLSAGIEIASTKYDGDNNADTKYDNGSNLDINFVAAGAITFYFM